MKIKCRLCGEHTSYEGWRIPKHCEHCNEPFVRPPVPPGIR
jgi:hypothetical protein